MTQKTLIFALSILIASVSGCVSYPAQSPSLGPTFTMSEVQTTQPITSLAINPSLTMINVASEETATAIPTLENDTASEYVPCWFSTSEQIKRILSIIPKGWNLYINAGYCFAFSYPPDWIVTAAKNFVAVSPRTDPTIALTIGFRKNTENIRIVPTGLSAGDTIEAGEVRFMGKNISKVNLVYEGKIKKVLYNMGEIPVDDLRYFLALSDYRSDVPYEAISLSDTLIATSDAIVGTFMSMTPSQY